MRITEVRADLMSSLMPEPMHMTFYGGERTIYKRDSAMVRVMTDGGLKGCGPVAASEHVVAAINSVIRDALVGEDPARIDSLCAKILSEASEDTARAFSGVEVALYDLLGRMEGCPVHALLGGKVRDRIRLYGSAGMYQPPESYAAEAAEVKALGFPAYKLRPALGPEADLETVRLVRETVGESVGLMVDAHAWWRMGDLSYTPGRIEQLARDMADYGLTWLEEPLPPEDHDAYVRLREAGIVPIAAGEHETSVEGFMEIVGKGAVDVAQADVSHHGGYSGVRRVIQACESHGRTFAFHNWDTVLDALACGHLGVCFPADACAWLEYPCFSHRGQDIMYPFPLADDILKEPLRIEEGDLVVPDGPGLGIDVDETVVERYPYRPGPWTVFRLTSPPGEWAMGSDHTVKWEKPEIDRGI